MDCGDEKHGALIELFLGAGVWAEEAEEGRDVESFLLEVRDGGDEGEDEGLVMRGGDVGEGHFVCCSIGSSVGRIG